MQAIANAAEKKPLTDAEVHAWFAQLEANYNKPEAEARRRAEAEEQERRGRESWAKWRAKQEAKERAKKPRRWGTLAELGL
jgi:hypothetical protein